MSDHEHRWSPTGLPFGWSFLWLRRHVQEAHPGVYLGLANWKLTEVHGDEHGREKS